MFTLKRHFYQAFLTLIIGIMGLSYANQSAATSIFMNPLPNPVSGVVTINGGESHTLPVTIATLQVTLNNNILGSPTFVSGTCSLPGGDCNSNWEFIWNTTTVANGMYTLTAQLTDSVGGFFAVSQSVTVNNPVVATYSCAGYMPPFDTAIALNSKTQKVIPIKAQIFDSAHNIVTSSNILGNAPIVNVSYLPTNNLNQIDVTSELLSPGSASSGNVFQYDPVNQTWSFNLSSKPYSAAGTYTVSMLSGDVTKYDFNASCQQAFVRAP